MAADPSDTNVFPFNTPKWTGLGKSFLSKWTLDAIATNDNIEQEIRKLSPIERIKSYTVLGKSNVGKSTLINSLVDAPIAKTSKTPGKTRQLLFYSSVFPGDQSVQLIDAPGYGFAKAQDESWKHLISKYYKTSPNIFRTFTLIDSKVGLTKQDDALFDLLTELKQPFFVVLTKADKSREDKIQSLVQSLVGRSQMFSPIVFVTSAKAGFGIPELRAYLTYSLYNVH